MSQISIKQISKSFSDKVVLKGLSLTIEYGKTICIMGESGCGKTTLVNILLGLESADTGVVVGVPQKVSAVFQEDRLCEDFSALSNVSMVLPKYSSKEKAGTVLNGLEMGDVLHKPVKKLSGGMQRRVAIARALAADADFCILDEPFKGLDDATKDKVIAFVKNSLKGKTVLLITHDIIEAKKMGAEIYTMQENGLLKKHTNQ